MAPMRGIPSEYRIVRPSDGQVRWIACEAQIERDEKGKPLRMVGAHIDITERTLAKELLRESEERFRLIANSAPVPMWVSKLDGTRGFANQAYLDFLGLDYQKAIVFDWRKILHPDDLSRIVGESLAGEASLQAVCAGSPLSSGRRRMEMDAIGIAAALGSGGQTHRLYRGGSRHHGRQGSRRRIAPSQ